MEKKDKEELIEEIKKDLAKEVKTAISVEIKEETKEKIDEISKAIADKFEELKKGKATEAEFKEFAEKLEKRFDEIETKMNRLPLENLEAGKESTAEETKAFDKWMRKGDKGLSPEEFKLLKISDAETGGYLAVAEYVKEIIKTITEFSPMRTIARIRTTSNFATMIPKRTGQFSAYWVAEAGEKVEATGLTYGLETVTPHCMAALIKATKENLEDSAFNLQAEITGEMGEQFAVLEGHDFILGDGVGKPEGILINAAVVAAAITSTTASIVTADDIMGLPYELKEGYTRNAKFLMKRSTVKAVRLLKEATTNAFIWQPGLAQGQPPTLAGYPIVECVDMPVIADSALAIAFGNFKVGYTIVDRVQMEIQRLIEKYAEFNEIGFIGRKRVDGQVVNPEAIKLLKIKAA